MQGRRAFLLASVIGLALVVGRLDRTDSGPVPADPQGTDAPRSTHRPAAQRTPGRPNPGRDATQPSAGVAPRGLDATHGLDATTVVAHEADRRSRPLRLETRRIAADGSRIRVVDLDVDGDGATLLSEDGVVERWTSSADVREQSWHFPSRPAGGGELAVDVLASGLSHVREDAQGHHFVDPANGAGVVYGHATFVDAQGKRTPIRVVHDRGVLRMKVPASVVDTSSFPAVLDPVVRPEFAVDTTLAYRERANDQTLVGTGCAAGRCIALYDTADSDDRRHRFVRFTTSGAVTEPAGLPFPAVSTTSQIVGVVADDDAFVVFDRDGNTLRRTVVPSTGAVGTLQPVAVRSDLPSDLQMAFDGTHAFFAGWRTTADGQDVMLEGFRVAADGTLVDSVPRTIPTLGYTFGWFRVVPSPSGFLVTFAETSGYQSWDADIGYVRLASDGTAIDPLPRRLYQGPYTQSWALRGAAGGGIYFVAFPHAAASNTPGFDIVGVRVDIATGNVLDAEPIVLDTAMGFHSRPTVDPVFDGSAFAFVTRTDVASNAVPHYEVHRFGVDGARVVPPVGDAIVPFPAAGGYQDWMRVVTDGTSLVGVFQSQRLDAPSWAQTDVYATAIPLTSFAPPAEDWRLTSRSGWQQPGYVRDCAAWNGANHLVAWRDDAFGETVRARLLDVNGATLGAPFTLPFEPSILVGRTGGFLAITTYPAELRFLDANGTTTSTVPGVADGFAVLGAAVRDDAILAVLSKETASKLQLHLRAFAADGTPRGLEPFAFTPPGLEYSRSSADVAAFGSDFVVAYSHPVPPDAVRFGVGIVDKTTGLVTSRFEDTEWTEDTGEDVRIACAPTRCLLAFRGRSTGRVRGRFFDAAGFLGSSFEVERPESFYVGQRRDMRVVFDGRSFSVVWTRGLLEPAEQLVVVRIDDAGRVLDPGGFLLAPWNTREMAYLAGLTAPTDETVVAFYVRFVADGTLESTRLMGRVVETSDADGSSCVADAACASGRCIDGVCCATECGDRTTGDCLACSLAAGGDVDGVCGVVDAGTICAAASSSCAHPARCDGTSTACPAPLHFDVALECNDQMACTVDSCGPGGCAHAPSQATACLPDAGVDATDAGTADAGGTTPSDAAVASDASPDPDPDPTTDAGGCACALGSPRPRLGGPSVVAIAFVAALVGRRRRRAVAA